MTPEEFFAHRGPFTTQELAEVCRCSPKTIRKAIKAGVLQVCHLGRVVRIPASAARKFALEAGAESQLPAESSEMAREGTKRHDVLLVKKTA